jgi:hypothetical protein
MLLLYPFIEMCGNEKSYFLDENLYLYNNELPTNEHNKSADNAIKYSIISNLMGLDIKDIK